MIKNNQQGFSLIELIIVLVIVIVIMGSVAMLSRGAFIAAGKNSELTDSNQSLRTAQNFLYTDFSMIGEGINSAGANWIASNFVINNLQIGDALKIAPNGEKVVNVPLISTDNNIQNKIIVGTEKKYLNDTDRITFFSLDRDYKTLGFDNYWTECSVNKIRLYLESYGYYQYYAPKIKVGSIYLTAKGGISVFQILTMAEPSEYSNVHYLYFSEGDTLGLNANGPKGSTCFTKDIYTQDRQSALNKVKFVQYFVDESGNLVRRTTADTGQPEDTVIAENVQEFQLSYILRKENGVPLEQAKDELKPEEIKNLNLIKVRIVTGSKISSTAGNKESLVSEFLIGTKNLQYSQTPDTITGSDNIFLSDKMPQFGTPTPTPTPTNYYNPGSSPLESTPPPFREGDPVITDN